MITYSSVKELVDFASEKGGNISDLVMQEQSLSLNKTAEELYALMSMNYNVMKQSVEKGLQPGLRSSSGLSGGNASKLQQAVNEGRLLGGDFFEKLLIKALAVSEYNACMGKIVAAPTAGSCGIIPSILLTIAEERRITEEKAVMSLFTAAGIGMVIAKRASISGAEGGCQAECGSASAMAAALAVELMGGTPEAVAEACAIALKNVLGLVCDPVAGLVEIPCIKRNAACAANALVAADLALAGIKSIIPADEVIDAMKYIGLNMSDTLRETAQGGLAATPTGKKIADLVSKLI